MCCLIEIVKLTGNFSYFFCIFILFPLFPMVLRNFLILCIEKVKYNNDYKSFKSWVSHWYWFSTRIYVNTQLHRSSLANDKIWHKARDFRTFYIEQHVLKFHKKYFPICMETFIYNLYLKNDDEWFRTPHVTQRKEDNSTFLI